MSKFLAKGTKKVVKTEQFTAEVALKMRKDAEAKKANLINEGAAKFRD